MEISLNKNGFHRKLQTFVFGKKCPLYNSFCPYFWLTICSAILTFLIPVAPTIFILKWIGISILYVTDNFSDFIEKNICEPALRNKALNMDSDELLMGWFSDNSHSWDDYSLWVNQIFSRKKLYKNEDVREKKFEIWKQNNPNWEQQLIDLREKRKKFFLEQQAEKERIREQIREQEILDEKRRERKQKMTQQFFTSIVKYTKWVALVIAAVVIYYVGYWIYLLGLYIADHFYYDKFIEYVIFIGTILFFAGGALGVVFLFLKIFQSISCKISCFVCKINWSWLNNTLKFVGVIFKYIGLFLIAIGKIFKFLWNGIIMFKQEYCPGINWENK